MIEGTICLTVLYAVPDGCNWLAASGNMVPRLFEVALTLLCSVVLQRYIAPQHCACTSEAVHHLKQFETITRTER
jgi:hypothetical protein